MSKTKRLTTITPRPGTPTYARGFASSHGRKGKIKGIDVWLKGESPSDGKWNQSPYNERAAYIVDRLLDLNIVPTTVLYLIKGEVVSTQRWVNGQYPPSRKPPILEMFDYIIGNTDRHGGNWFVKPSGKVWAIDNALSFTTYVGVFYCNDLPDEASKIKQKLLELLDNKEKSYKRLSCVLSKEKIDALLLRMKIVLRKITKKGGTDEV